MRLAYPSIRDLEAASRSPSLSVFRNHHSLISWTNFCFLWIRLSAVSWSVFECRDLLISLTLTCRQPTSGTRTPRTLSFLKRNRLLRNPVNGRRRKKNGVLLKRGSLCKSFGHLCRISFCLSMQLSDMYLRLSSQSIWQTALRYMWLKISLSYMCSGNCLSSHEVELLFVFI